MKKIISLCFLAIATVMFVACDFGQSVKQQLEYVRTENDSLLQVTIEQQNDIADLVSTLNAAASKLDDINGQIAINSGDQSLQNQRARILQQLDNIQQQITEKQNLLADIQKKYKNVLGENKELKKSIERMQKEITGYQNRIAEYETRIATQSERIGQLSTSLAETETRLQKQIETTQDQAAVIESQDVALNRCYFIVARKSTLKDLGLVEGGVFNKTRLSTKGFDTTGFTETDKRSLSEIALGSKGARLLTSAPESSYEMVKGIDKSLTLRILDKESFWSLSRYLVVMID